MAPSNAFPCVLHSVLGLLADPPGPSTVVTDSPHEQAIRMTADATELEELPRAECMRLMAGVPIGRIVYTCHAMPAVEPVNFVIDDGVIVIRTDASGKLAAAVRRAVVAFQADDLDLVTRSGWSVTVVGPSKEVTDPAEVARLDRLGLRSWAPGARVHFIRIVPGMVSGRRLHRAAD